SVADSPPPARARTPTPRGDARAALSSSRERRRGTANQRDARTTARVRAGHPPFRARLARAAQAQYREPPAHAALRQCPPAAGVDSRRPRPALAQRRDGPRGGISRPLPVAGAGPLRLARPDRRRVRPATTLAARRLRGGVLSALP